MHASLFTGDTSRATPVTVALLQGVLSVHSEDGDLRRESPVNQLRISERLERAPRTVEFKDGAVLAVADRAFDTLLFENGYKESLSQKLQRNWAAALVAVLIAIAAMSWAYFVGLPKVADYVAQRVPVSIERKIGDGQLAFLDSNLFQPSQLSTQRQKQLRDAFTSLRTANGQPADYRIEFRDSSLGANAFALADGSIILTDALVARAPNDDAIMGVLAHELGHVERRHIMRRLIQVMGVGVLTNLYLGDASWLLAISPSVLLEQSYSRDFEREADQYAIEMMRKNNVPLSPMAELFARLARDAQVEDRHNANGSRRPQTNETRQAGIGRYLHSHPSDAERIATLRAADAR